MKNYINSWRTSMSSDKNPLLLSEGLFDIGLPAEVAETINSILEGVPEKGKTQIGKVIKDTKFKEFREPYKTKLLNDVKDYGTQMLDLFINMPKKGFDNNKIEGPADLGEEYADQYIQMRDNLESTLSGVEPVGYTIFPWNYETTLANIQKASKMMKKSFKKGIFAKVHGKALDPEIIENIDSNIYDSFAEATGDLLKEIQIWLKQHPTNYRNISNILLDDPDEAEPIWSLIEYAQKWLSEVEKEEQKVHTFDDKSFWYNLMTNTCTIEGKRMGHCGGDIRGDTLYSLRYWEEGKEKSSSYVTVSFSNDAKKIFQIKGRYNAAPEEEYYHRIAWLVKHLGNPDIVETGEHSKDWEGFSKMSTWLAENTDAEVQEINNPLIKLQADLQEKEENLNDQYYFSKINFYIRTDEWNPNEPFFYAMGYVGIFIEKDEFTEESLEMLQSESSISRDGMDEISTIMSIIAADGKLLKGTPKPPTVTDKHIIFYFYVTNRWTSNGETSQEAWSKMSSIEDFTRLGEDILEIDTKAGESDSELQNKLQAALIHVGLIDGGPFIILYNKAIAGNVQKNSDWILETDTDMNDKPKLVWVMTPTMFLTPDNVEEYVSEEYYRKPQVMEKILNSDIYKELFSIELSEASSFAGRFIPKIKTWDVTPARSPKGRTFFGIEAAWEVLDDSSEEMIEVIDRWTSNKYQKNDFNLLIQTAYYKTLNKLFDLDWENEQETINFPGGRRLPIDESKICNEIHKNWVQKFKGF